MLAALICLICVASVTGMALLAVQHTHWDWLSLPLGAAIILLITAVIWLLLDVLDNWIDRADRRRAGAKQ